MQQRSKEWYEVRKGRFTASEISRLLGKDTLQRTKDAIDNYAFEKATELVYGIDEEDSFTSFDMLRGINLEPLAFNRFQEMMAYKFIEVKEASFFPYGSDAGASPDGVAGDDACLEIKCPRPAKFFKLVAKGYEAIDSEYLAQMQFQMLCTNSKRCHFFNYIIYNGREMWHEVIVERDEEMITLIKERLEQAIKIRNDYMTYLIENQQFETVII
jgi:exodeoxyribonuclease (lambda-induced)